MTAARAFFLNTVNKVSCQEGCLTVNDNLEILESHLRSGSRRESWLPMD